MTELTGAEHDDVKFPGIKASKDHVLICERPYLRDILLFLFFLACTIYVFYSGHSYNKEIGIIVCSFSSLLFLYNSVSLKRIKIDLRNRMIYRSNVNPFLILLEKCLRHPETLSFKKISSIYYDNHEAFVPSGTKYYVIIRTDDPYDLKIAAFTEEEDAKQFSQYLNLLIH
jgi:hypothetical protein